LDDKSGGFQVQTSELQTPEALERLFLILAIATLHFTSIGLEVVRAGGLPANRRPGRVTGVFARAF